VDVLPEPMLSRPGPIPTGRGWQFEPKWDGFRALVATERDVEVLSRVTVFPLELSTMRRPTPTLEGSSSKQGRLEDSVHACLTSPGTAPHALAGELEQHYAESVYRSDGDYVFGHPTKGSKLDGVVSA
jgi:hypothetical protein